VRVVDWYLDLRVGQKIVVGVAVVVGIFLVDYFASLLILSSLGVGEGAPPEQAGTPAPSSLRLGSTSASSSASPASEGAVEIQRARWKDDKVVVEGKWRGDLSSVHCDLLEGGETGRAIDWWDRSVAARMSFSGRTFSQEFVRAEGRKVKDRIDPEGDYWVACSAQFSDGLATGDEAPVEGTPGG